jgi:hypothetical protein
MRITPVAAVIALALTLGHAATGAAQNWPSGWPAAGYYGNQPFARPLGNVGSGPIFPWGSLRGPAPQWLPTQIAGIGPPPAGMIGGLPWPMSQTLPTPPAGIGPPNANSGDGILGLTPLPLRTQFGGISTQNIGQQLAILGMTDFSGIYPMPWQPLTPAPLPAEPLPAEWLPGLEELSLAAMVAASAAYPAAENAMPGFEAAAAETATATAAASKPFAPRWPGKFAGPPGGSPGPLFPARELSARVTRLARARGVHTPTGITVLLGNGTAVLQGTVGSAADAVLIGNLVSLEPGIWQVESRLTVAPEGVASGAAKR